MADQKISWRDAIKYRIAGIRQDVTSAIPGGGFGFGEGLTLSSLIGFGSQTARTRTYIYQKYQQMMTDPIVSGALRNHVTAALGGEEKDGQMVFIEPSSTADTAGKRLAEEIAGDLTEMLNRIAVQVTYNGAGFGDAYARLYTSSSGKRKGIADICADEMMLPPLVQPYEVGNETVVCLVAIGDKLNERLGMNQIARLKMPRMIYTPQPMAVEKAVRTRVQTNDVEGLPLLPSLVGGSFLADAEAYYANFASALTGLVGQRLLDSIDESMFTVQLSGMDKEQRTEYMTSVKNMLAASKKAADDAVKAGTPMLTRLRHLIPVWGDKQLVQVQGVNSGGGSGGGRSGTISIEDVMFHAKVLAGCLGTDLTMLGFADQMSGGLGEGGFFRTSVQAAERSRSLRKALADMLNHIIDVHVGVKYGVAFEPGKRPWDVNFFGNIAAMEAERQKTAMDGANTALLVLQVMQQAKELGLDAKATEHFLMTEAKLSREDAKMYAAAIEKARSAEQGDQGGMGGFGGVSGGGRGGRSNEFSEA